jgi:hypothetical protein
MYFQMWIYIGFKWQGVFLKYRGGAKTGRRKETNSDAQKASLHFLKIYFQKKYMEKESKKILRKRIL